MGGSRIRYVNGWHPSALYPALASRPKPDAGPSEEESLRSGSPCESPRICCWIRRRQERAHRRRVQALEQRLSSLTMPPPLRRALSAAVSQLREGRPEVAAQVLSQLVAPARDAGGAEAGDAIALAAREARRLVSGEPAKRTTE